MKDPRIQPFLDGLHAMTRNAQTVAAETDDHDQSPGADAAAEALSVAYDYAVWCLR